MKTFFSYIMTRANYILMRRWCLLGTRPTCGSWIYLVFSHWNNNTWHRQTCHSTQTHYPDSEPSSLCSYSWFCKLQKGCTGLAAAMEKVYQLLVHGRRFSLGTLASSTIKTGCHDIAEILLKVVFNTINQINQIK